MRLTIGDMAQSLGLDAEGDLSLPVSGAARPDQASVDDIALAMDPRFLGDVAKGGARAVLAPPGTDWRALGVGAAIFAPRARVALAGATRLFSTPPDVAPGVHPTAVVADDAEIGDGAAIGPFSIVGRGARIGAGAKILGHASIAEGADLGPDSLIYYGVRIGARITIGARAIIHPNAVIGSDGFSFVTPERGGVEEAKASGGDRVSAGGDNAIWARIYSIGAVVVGDDVEIGANAAIDRGTVVDTRIGNGTKIDNLVQIGHNVQVGAHCLLCGHVGVAGSAEIGDRVVLGGKCGVADQSRIGSDVVVMAGSGVSGVVKSGSVIGGVPAVSRTEFGASVLALRRLPRIIEQFREVKRSLESIKKRFPDADGSG